MVHILLCFGLDVRIGFSVVETSLVLLLIKYFEYLKLCILYKVTLPLEGPQYNTDTTFRRPTLQTSINLMIQPSQPLKYKSRVVPTSLCNRVFQPFWSVLRLMTLRFRWPIVAKIYTCKGSNATYRSWIFQIFYCELAATFPELSCKTTWRGKKNS